MDLGVGKVETTRCRRAVSRRAICAQLVVLCLLVGLLYYRILGDLVSNWYHDPNFSHGFLIPLFSGFVFWQRRRQTAALPAKPAGFGLVVIAMALAELIVGVLGAELFLSRSSFILLLAGFLIYFLGWNHFRGLLFPWACLFLAIPIPAIIFNQITFPLQLLASKLGASILPFLGVPVLREGNILQLPALSLEVAEACSGIRSLLSLGTLAIVYGYFFEPSVRRRLALVAAAIPIAVAANALRIVTTALLVQYWDPYMAESLVHFSEGLTLFLLSFGLIVSLHGFMGAIGRSPQRRQH